MNSLTSPDVFIPFDYYSLPFCKPATIVSAAENLGELLTGNRIENSVYDVQMNIPKFCALLCPPMVIYIYYYYYLFIYFINYYQLLN